MSGVTAVNDVSASIDFVLSPGNLRIDVNYAHEWVAGGTEPSASVVVTVTDGGGALKESAVVTADGAGGFFVGCADWASGQCPDIEPGDRVFAFADGLLREVSPVGEIPGRLDAVADTVSGTLYADWFGGQLDVGCEVWEPNGPPGINRVADTNGGLFQCDFSGSWDLLPGHMVALKYYEPDGDTVINIVDWPWVRANYAHDWVGADYEPGHTFWITVTDSTGAVKATTASMSAPGWGWIGSGGFESENDLWLPAPPDIQPGDFVYFTADNGYTNTLEIGSINGSLDIASDVITGTLLVPSTSITLTVECHPWGAWQAGLHSVQIKSSWAEPDGSIPFSCQWDPANEWDIQAGQSIGVLYIEPDLDRVVDVYRDPAPHLRISKWADGAPGEGGNLAFHLSYENLGDAPAEGVVITDTLEGGMSYLMHTSPFAVMTTTVSPDVEMVTLDVGTVDPESGSFFDVFVEVEAAISEPLTNTAQIATTSPYDQGDPGDKSASWVGVVDPNLTHLNVGKWAWTGDPTPGQDVVFTINVCNNGPTGSSQVTLTDTLHQKLAFQSWWSQHAGWYEISSDPGELIVAIHSISGHSCSEVYVRATLSANALPGDYISNTANIAAANDLETHDNSALWESNANSPHANLWIDKRWNGGELVPGGRLSYGISYGNDGNVPVGSVTITDTLPVGTSFVNAWHGGPAGGYEFPPSAVIGNLVIWTLPGLDNGVSGNFEAHLSIDPAANPGDPLVNTVQISPQPAEDSYGDNVSQWTETLGAAGSNLRIRKWHEWQGVDRLAYRVRFDNVGDAPISSVAITDTLPADTTWDGWWDLGFDWARLVGGIVQNGNQLSWSLSEVLPGETGWLYFNAELDQPGDPLRWYTNTVQISLPPGDTDPADNVSEDVSFSGGEVKRVDLRVEPWGDSSMWGEAVASQPVTVTTPSGQFNAWADPACGGCWGLGSVGPLAPGDLVEVAAGSGSLPVQIAIPDPLTASADSATEEVFGQIGGWLSRPLEVYGEWPGGHVLVTSDGAGNFLAVYPDVPYGASGTVVFDDAASYAEVVYHVPFRAGDLVMDVNYGHDWIEGPYEPGHTIWITVTESDGLTVKGVAELETGFVPWWGGASGFSSSWQGWQGVAPDLMPGDWILAESSNSFTAAVQLGIITGTLDVGADTVSGTVTAPFAQPLLGMCEVWAPGGPAVSFQVDPAGGAYLCDFGALGWDLQGGQDVAVRYEEPDGHDVIDVYRDPASHLRIEKHGTGVPAAGGNFIYRIDVWNDGDAPAESVVVTDTLPVGATYITDTSGLPQTSTGVGLVGWEAGTIDPGQGLAFDLYVAVGSSPYVTITNSVEITTSSPFDAGQPGDRAFESVEQTQPNDTHLTVAKWAQTPNPAPGENFIFVVNVCNEGTTGSTTVTLTDSLHPLLSLASWTGGAPWYEVSSSPGELVLAIPSIAGNSCRRVRMTVYLDPAAQPGQLLTNTAVIAAANDLEASDNEARWEGLVTDPLLNLAVEKSFDAGSLVPGGWIRYRIDYANTGNVPVLGSVYITDTFPADTTFVSAWHNGWQSGWDFPPAFLDPTYAVWEIAGLDNNSGGNFEVLLNIDHGASPGSVLSNTVAISPQAGEFSYVDNTSVWVETLSAPGANLRVVKEHDWNAQMDSIAYEVRFDNIGSVPVTSVAITDTLPTDTTWDGTWNMDFDWARLVGGNVVDSGGALSWLFSEVHPGESGHLWFNAALDQPGGPSSWFTNTVEITVPVGDASPANNVFADVAYSEVSPGASIMVEKLTNGLDADGPPGPYIAVGQPITWTYIVTNTGQITLTDVVVVDDPPVAVSCNTSTLGAAEATVCSASDVAQPDQFANVATASGTPPGSTSPVYASDSSHYYGALPAVALQMLVNGVSAETPPGPSLVAGETITFTYTISNTGNVLLTGVGLFQQPEPPGGLFGCPGDTVQAGASMSCYVSDTVTLGQFGAYAAVSGTPPGGLNQVWANAAVHYFGVVPGIQIEKLTNGVDADEPPGLEIAPGDPITWTYVVTNTGSVELTGLEVTDDQGVVVACPQTVLAAGEHMTCNGSGTAEDGPYANKGTVVGYTPAGAPVSDSDSSHYVGGLIIFADGFESGDSSAWDGREPP
jgi:uncharacterized repeat protein (TIGR01451 family)